MAWTGIPVVKLVTDGLVRITGVSLAGAASGTISLAGDGGGIELPAGFDAESYADVSLADAIQVSYVQTANDHGESRHIHVTKSSGPPFLITVDNDGGQATSDLEIYVRFH